MPRGRSRGLLELKRMDFGNIPGIGETIAGLIGYLNLSHGTPSGKFQRGISELFRVLAGRTHQPTWYSFFGLLRERMETREELPAAFGDVTQARSVLDLVENHVLPGYRQFHRDLLFHLPDDDMFQPFFLARVFESTLAMEPPWEETSRIVGGVLNHLNDYLGHRPVAVLETAQRIQPYSHERCRPIPVYLEGAGIAFGKYEALLDKTLEILASTDPELRAASSFDLDRLSELALDPRAYDHSHPVNQRPGYQFGEWDPHQLDFQGRYRRFVIRPMILDSLLEWDGGGEGIAEEELLFETAAALAGTILLASGISGSGPDAHTSDVTLANLVPRVARCRDRFYQQLLLGLKGPMGTRLRRDAKLRKQPFGGVRQFLNHSMARMRASQLQHDYLSRLYAKMGFSDASRRQSMVIPTPSIRMRAELENQITAGHRAAERGDVAAAAEAIERCEDILDRAIECGAFVDPWNVLGFQGNFSIFTAMENSTFDARVEHLLECMQRLFDLQAHALRESAANGDAETRKRLQTRMNRRADWWDKYATVEVSDVTRVSGRESAAAASFVANVLVAWRESGAASGDVAFWRKHAAHFNSPSAFASVVDALMDKQDYVSAMALLMQWLSQVEQVPLDDGESSFHAYAVRWVQGILRRAWDQVACDDSGAPSPANHDYLVLLVKFFDYLEANADQLWRVPGRELFGEQRDEETEEDEEDIFAAAYEGITYEDSTDDGREGAMIEGGGPANLEGDTLAHLERILEQRLRFHSTVARLWRWAAEAPWSEVFPCPVTWTKQALQHTRDLGRLMDALFDYKIPAPMGSQDSVMEYDQRQAIKENLLSKTISTTIETAHALRRLRGQELSRPASETAGEGLAKWEPLVIAVEQALRRGLPEEARARVPPLFAALKSAPLLYVPLDKGGNPRAIFQARYVRDTLRQLAIQLPTLGLHRETYCLLEAAMEIESGQAGSPHQVTEFNLLFPAGFRAVIESVVESMSQWPETRGDDHLVTSLVGTLVGKFSRLWVQHVSNVRISELERRVGDEEWAATFAFIRKYGRDLFTQKFMTYANLRGILHQGVDTFLEAIRESQQPEVGGLLAADLGVKVDPKEAATQLEFVFRAILENYDSYKDYNTTTTQSDYGENLYLLLELLRVRMGYERHRWALQPAYIAHGVLARKFRPEAALLLHRAFREETEEIADGFQQQLEEAGRRLGLRLPTIEDRIGERFVRPLNLDRLLALIEPAIEEGRMSGHSPSFEKLEQELESFGKSAVGAGLDVPSWIVQLEQEVRRVLESSIDVDENLLYRLRRRRSPLTHADFEKQILRWDRPLEEDGNEDAGEPMAEPNQ
ncbi:MAG: hypothetical protein U1D30_08155 [Planctomycetota bacterium]